MKTAVKVSKGHLGMAATGVGKGPGAGMGLDGMYGGGMVGEAWQGEEVG